MLEIKILASSSAGNAYAIYDDDSKILIDPGIGISEIKKSLNFGLSSTEFCLLSHEHQDHSRSISDIAGIGIPCAMSLGTFNTIDNSKFTAPQIILESERPWTFGRWQVLPFEIEHDATEPLGFLINTPSMAKILFVTDTCYVGYKFAGVTHYIVECNYSEKLLIENQKLIGTVKARIRKNHFELENVKEFFRQQDLTKTEKIYLIHLSDSNSSEDYFIDEIQKVTGKPVYLR